MKLDGRRILVVGASSGVGRCAALAMAERGAEVVFAARRPNLVLSTALSHLSEHAVAAVVSSDSSSAPRHSLVPYGCSKAALEASMEGWRTEETGGRRFVTIVLGPTHPSEFGSAFDPEEFASLFPFWQRQGFRTGSLATPEVGAYLAESIGFMLEHPGFNNETMLLRAPEPDEAVTDYGTGLHGTDTSD